jgi:hypothetical protein
VVKLVTWLAIVPTAKSVSPGATTTVSATAVSQLVLAVPQRTSSTHLWPRWEALVASLARRSNTTATALLAETTTVEASAPSSHGSVVPLEALHLGRVTATTVVEATVARPLLRLGLVAAAVVVNPTIKATVLVMVRLPGLLLLPLLLQQELVMDMVVMATTRTLVWVLLVPMVLLVTVLPHLLLVLLLALVLSSRRTDLPAARHHLHHHRLVPCRHRPLQARPLHLRRLAMSLRRRHRLRLRCADVTV